MTFHLTNFLWLAAMSGGWMASNTNISRTTWSSY